MEEKKIKGVLCPVLLTDGWAEFWENKISLKTLELFFLLLLLHFSFVVPINSRNILCTAKKAIDKMEGQHPEWEKIFANDTNDKGFIYKIYKKHTQLSTKKTPIEPHLKNGQKTWIDSFSKEVCRWSTNTGKTAQHGTYQGNVNQNHLSPHTC